MSEGSNGRRRPIAILLCALSFWQGACSLKHPYVLKEEAEKRKQLAAAPEATCWQRAEGFRTTRTGFYKMAPEPEAIVYAGPLNFIILPGLAVATVVMGVFTVPFDFLALAFRCLNGREPPKAAATALGSTAG